MAVQKTFVDVEDRSDLEMKVMVDTIEITIASAKGCEYIDLDFITAVQMSKELKRLIAELKEQQQ